jgi:hypothetical protein
MENLFLNQALQTRLLLALQKKSECACNHRRVIHLRVWCTAAATWTAEQLFAAEKHDFMAAVNKFIGLQLDATVCFINALAFFVLIALDLSLLCTNRLRTSTEPPRTKRNSLCGSF